MGDLREPSGVVLEDLSSSSSSSLSFPGREVWARAERATQEIIRKVQPSVVSEERRKDVIDYVQSLVKGKLGCEVFPFGSVPLKTYLPDGDIDLTAFCRFDLEESYANDLYTVLEREDHNPDAEFLVKEVQYIRAEVKLVKCLVQNIVVDISFNQIGGLCALCFLEEVDRLIGKDNLFKRCIILIKAWCYYESRILGAHHGLISTYALETLVLHIFHLFHSSLSGPLAVLYKFLDYFSKFDWENYCVSLSGPVHVSSLPEIVAERPENGGVDLLLSHDFMRECVKKFCVPSRGTETNSRTFMQKHLNIVDPLKNHYSYRDRRGRIQGPVKSPRTNGRAPTTRNRSPQARFPVHQGPGKPICSDFYESSPRGKVFKETNGFVHASEKADEFAALGHPPT